MVASIQVISGNVSAAGAYYVALYYPGQEQGLWFGGAAPILGLTGKVTEDTFQKALCGQSPSGAQLVKQVVIKDSRKAEKKPDSNAHLQQTEGEPEQLERKSEQAKEEPEKSAKKEPQKKQNMLGVDETDSVGKDVSVLWARSNAARRKRIENCVLRASNTKNRWIEKNLNLARRGKNGQRRISGKLVGAQFLHTVSRSGEPQLHVHNVFSQMIYGEDGRWSKLDTKQLHTWTPTIGRIFRANLARELIKEFGLELVRPKDEQGKEKSWFTIAGVPKELCDANSSRRKAILEASGPHGNAKGKYAALVRQHAALNTRDKKDSNIDLEQMFEKVRNQADELGFTKDKLKNLFGRVELPQQKDLQPLYDKAFKNALTKLTEEVAHFRECDIVCEVVEELQHLGFDGSELATRVMEDIPNRPDLIQLREHQGEKQFTTKKTWDREARFLKDVETLRNRKGALLSYLHVERLLAKHPELFSEQQEGVKSLMSRPGAIRILNGDAGTGKSTALEVVRKGFEEQGFRVIGGALSGATTRDLEQKTGMDCRTVASHLFHLDKPLLQKIMQSSGHHARMLIREAAGKPTWKKLDHKLDSTTVLILDEAGMLSTKDLRRITHIVKKAGATLILAGDVEQLPAIGAGTPLKRLANEIEHTHLRTNLRQQDPEDRTAVSQLRSGAVREALDNYASRGRLVIGDDHFDTAIRLVEVWKNAGGPSQPARHVVLTQTKSDAKLINTLCQSERLSVPTSAPPRSIVFGDTKYYEGDRVLFHKALRMLGVENGHFAKITAVDSVRQEVTVRMERERTPRERAKGLGQSVVVKLSDAPKELLSLGFAATSHKLQGATIDHAYVLLSGPLSSKEMAYVQATRARFSTHLFADRASAGKDLEKLEKSLKRSRVKSMAHDLGKQPTQSQSLS